MSTQPATTEPTWEVVNGDAPLSDAAISAIDDQEQNQNYESNGDTKQ